MPTTKREPKITPKMKLLDKTLQYEHNTSLRAFLTKSRRANATPDGPLTWDDIAREIWTLTGEKVVRESMISYARRLGLAPERVLGPTEGIAPSADLAAQDAA